MGEKYTTVLKARIEQVTDRLMEQNDDYALARRESGRLLQQIELLLHGGDAVILQAEDCACLKEYIMQKRRENEIIQNELYLQGYFDGLKTAAISK